MYDDSRNNRKKDYSISTLYIRVLNYIHKEVFANESK